MRSKDFLKIHLNTLFFLIQEEDPGDAAFLLLHCLCSEDGTWSPSHRAVQSVPLQVSSTGAVLVTDWIFLVSVPPLLSQESEEILADTFPASCVVLLFIFLLILSVNPLLCLLTKNPDGALAFLPTNIPEQGVCTIQDE